MKNLFKYFILFIICIFNISVCKADILPQNISDIPKDSMGLYQTDRNIIVYAKPDDKSNIVYSKKTNYEICKNINTDNFYAVLIPSKELGYAYVTDVADDEVWVQVVYDKEHNLRGWIQKNDEFQFLPWGTFFNMYGRKYGLYQLKSGSTGYSSIYSQTDVNSQIMGEMSNPKYIKMIAIEGYWMLISVLDTTNNTITGYVQWCTNQGDILLFPDIK